MKKRIISMLLCLGVLLTLLPTAALAALTPVNTVQLTMDAPAAGKTPAATGKLPSTASTCVTNVKWDGALDGSGKFQNGVSYTVHVTLGIKSGVDRVFDSSKMNATINGKSAKVESRTSTKLVIQYTWPKLGESPVITRLDLTVTAPRAGETPSETVSGTTNLSPLGAARLTKVDWGGGFDKGAFMLGTSYTVYITVQTADSDYSFSKDLKATVNGNEAKISGTGASRRISYSFKPTEEEKTAVREEDRFTLGKYYTMDQIEDLRTSDRDLMLVGSSLADLDVLSQVEQRRLRAFVITGHDVEGAKKLVAKIGGMFDLFRVNEIWFGPEYTGDEIYQIMSFGNRYYKDTTCSGHMLSNDSRIYVSEQTLKTIDTEINGDNVRVYKGDDVVAAAKRGPEDTRNWCTNHVFIGPSFDAGTVYTYNDCKNIARFYRVCAWCGECERDPNHTYEWIVNGVHDTSSEPIHDFAELVTDKAYLGTDVNGKRVYSDSCRICGALRMQANSTPVKKALNGEETAFAFRPDSVVNARVSSWAQAGTYEALTDGLVDEALLGGDYTQACSRLQFCSVAVRLAEKMTGKTITPAPASTFTDTQNEYVLKAYAAGITGGTGPSTFSPDATLTRQQMAVFLNSALRYVKNNSDLRYTPYESRLDTFTDNGQIAGWAREGMAFMNALGLISGTSATTLSPNNNCTIEQALLVANRSLDAHKIGWYMVRTDKQMLRDMWFGYCTFYSTAGANTYYNYVPGEVIWMTDWRSGVTNAFGGTLITVDPESGLQVKAVADNFVPIRVP